ncbi:MAG TPA: hypothetical protein VME45_05385 [Stellaceae bacterium]|nr:hypothetical protein [Stellaceae bacterium]
MVRYLLVAAMLALCPGLAMADSWHGQIQCAVIPAFGAKPLFGAFDLTAKGDQLAYSRPVHVSDSADLSGVMENGEGTAANGQIVLQGRASGPGYSYTARYQGPIQGNSATLTGEQVWTGHRLSQPFHRACAVTLSR